MTDTTLVCPRCQGPMNSFERARVQIDQCANCRGIFLDRGELERLLEAEASYYPQDQQVPAYPAQQPPPGYPPQPAPGYYDDDEHHGHDGHHDEHHDEHHGYGRRRGFLHELFE